jgi:glycosyltransferase involved in cell wall biosynthesis
LRILQVCPFSMKVRGGGVAEHVWNISKRLAQKHDVTLFGLNPHSRYSRFDVVDGVKIERFKHYYPNGSYYLSIELPLRLRHVEFDVVHGHGYHAFPMHFAALAKHKKFVVTTHFHGEGHSVFRESLFKLFQPFGKVTLRKADVIIAVSEFEKSLLCERFSFEEDKIVVIPNGLDLTEFADLKSNDCDFRSVLYVGRLESYKGVHYLVEVLPKLDNSVVLEIVGKGPLRGFLEKRAKQLGVSERVMFYQDLSRKELLQKYADADVFVLLSKFEAYSISVAEALTAGTPCIVANTTALSEWIDNKNCFSVDYPINLNELAENISFVLDSGNGGDVASSKQTGNKILDWNEVVEQIEKAYGAL